MRMIFSRWKNIPALLAVFAVLAAGIAFVSFNAKPARSAVCLCVCAFPEAIGTIIVVAQEHQMTRDHFGYAEPIVRKPGATGHGSGEMGEHEDFLIKDIFMDRYLPAMMMMVEQMTTVMIHQALIIGSFIDARQQLETLLVFKKMAAQAHKDYHPSMTMCEFGTSVRSLAAAQSNADLGAFSMNKRFLDRQLGSPEASAWAGPDSDRSGNQDGDTVGRLGQFRQNFCDPSDLNRMPDNEKTGLFFCLQNPGLENGTTNLDIDFNRAVMMPRIINADFSQSDLEGGDQGALVAMSANLYGHDVFTRDKGILEQSGAWDEYMDIRALTAKRAVAQTTFNNIVAMKSRGTAAPQGSSVFGAAQPQGGSSADTANYIKMILKGLGTAGNTWDQAAMQAAGGADESGSLNRYLNNRNTDVQEISYYAQMEFLAKKFFQRPEFYTNLYDKPENVKREGVAMQAIGLMLDRDMYDSFLRSEMLLSMILELRVKRYQERVESGIKQLRLETK